ncbi:MAG: ATP-binding protein, partial [Cyanobacteria bacterium J06633_2]
LSLSLEHADLGQLLHGVLNLQTVAANQKGLWVTVADVPDGIIVNVDPAKLKQVFLNIIYNAIKFTDEGGITINLRVEYLNIGDKPSVHSALASTPSPSLTVSGSPMVPWIIVSITDTGIGIDPSQQDKLFKPFVMVDGSTTRKFEGTGLGLAISRNLVELMGGGITLYSAGSGTGTTVEIALPVIQLPTDGLLVEDDRPCAAPASDATSMSLNLN